VHPRLAGLIRAMAENLVLQGVAIRVVQGLRTWDEQAAIYAQGRTAPGKIVTQAQPGFSWHNFGLAVDCVPMTPLGPDWDSSHPAWSKMVAAGNGVGLSSGAMWRTFKDWPHFQLQSLPLTPTDYHRDAYAQHGVEGVWASAGLAVPSGNGEISV
jgi:peptidoglycan LD-endopeptidase CwlK